MEAAERARIREKPRGAAPARPCVMPLDFGPADSLSVHPASG